MFGAGAILFAFRIFLPYNPFAFPGRRAGGEDQPAKTDIDKRRAMQHRASAPARRSMLRFAV
jgi:hypothetical protein